MNYYQENSYEFCTPHCPTYESYENYDYFSQQSSRQKAAGSFSTYNHFSQDENGNKVPEEIRIPPLEYRQLCNAVSASLGKKWQHDDVPVPSITTSSVCRLRLETTYETRKEELKQQPYSDYGNGTKKSRKLASIWDYEPNYTGKCQTVVLRISNTTSEILCDRCYGKGGTGCDGCSGSGTQTCGDCFGGDGDCDECGGSVTVPCGDCGGNFLTDCVECEGKGRLEQFSQIVMTKMQKCENRCTNNVFNIPKYAFQDCQGYTVEIPKSKGEFVSPLTLKEYLDINTLNASNNILQSHEKFNIGNSRILKQKFSLSIIPVHEVTFYWKGKKKLMFVLGTNLTVFQVKTKQQSCCIS